LSKEYGQFNQVLNASTFPTTCDKSPSRMLESQWTFSNTYWTYLKPLQEVEHLEQDKIAQALEITKLKQQVKKLERRNKASKLRRLQKVGTAQRVETSDETVMDDVSK
nr:hypothetical protein [Tanacetum cinerariifolium]